ncbi:MAG TPA: hypothetical protein VLB51_05005 [Methylomirabilota bacterium]|nr:hypothetical protein [Methylomirabilota bacterium]
MTTRPPAVVPRLGLIAVVLLLAATDALAIPTFARRYRTSCATCHMAYPRLNSVGESFRLMGYQFPDDERYRKQQPVEMGDEAYKRLWPKALWPSHLPSNSPLSIISRFMVEVDLDGTRTANTTFLLPEEIELVWAGNLGDDISFYGDIIALQKDFGGKDPESWVTLKAWLQFQGLFGSDHAFNLRIGTVGTQTMGLFTARDANIYSTHFYTYSAWFLPSPGLDRAGLSEFRGNNFSIGPQTGIELNGVGRRWFYAVGLANGNLDVPAGNVPESDISFVGAGRNSDNKDLYSQLAYKIGGMFWDRSREPPSDTLTTGAQFWRDDALVLSLFGYAGTADLRIVDLDGAVWEGEDDFWRLGVGLQHRVKDVHWSLLYMAGSDDNPYGSLSDQAVDNTAWHAEVLGFVYPWMILYGRYESLEMELPEDVPGLDPDQDVDKVVAGAKLMVRPNISCNVEYTFYPEGAELEEGLDQTLFLLLSVSF